MATTEQRRILDMLAEGKITAEEGEQLLNALGGGGDGSVGSEAGAGGRADAKPRPKFLRVVVEKGDGKKEVDLRVPLLFLRSGIKLASILPASACGCVVSALNKEGVKVDLNKLKPQDVDDLVDQLADLKIDAGDEGESVRIFCE